MEVCARDTAGRAGQKGMGMYLRAVNKKGSIRYECVRRDEMR